MFFGLNVLFVGAGLVIIATGFAYHFPFWVAAMLPILAVILLVIIVVGGKSWKAHSRAWSDLQGIVHEEWRTRKQILPPDFPVGRWYALFRTPPHLTERHLRGLRRVEWIRGRRFTVIYAVWAATTFIALAGSAVGARYFGLSLWWPIAAYCGLLLPFMGGFFWALKDSDLLYHLREYERVTGTGILPPDLSKKA